MKAAYISLMTENKKPDLKAAAERALAEAEARKAAQPEQFLPPELGGRDGPEPVDLATGSAKASRWIFESGWILQRSPGFRTGFYSPKTSIIS